MAHLGLERNRLRNLHTKLGEAVGILLRSAKSIIFGGKYLAAVV